MKTSLRNLFLDALELAGYGVIDAIEQWNTRFCPEIKALPPGVYVYNIGRTEITFTKRAFKALVYTV